MKKFGFIGYPLNSDLWFKFNPQSSCVPIEDLKKHMMASKPIFASNITGVKSVNAEEIEGYLALVPLFPDQILDLDTKFVINKIVEACDLVKSKGARIVGLGGLTSVVGNQGEMVANKLDIAVTTGNSYTAAMTIEATNKAADLMGISVHKAKVAIVGATGSIGSICSYNFSETAREVVLVARNQRRLGELQNRLKKKEVSTVQTCRDIKEAIADADIVITATSAPQILVDVRDLKKGALVCDVAIPRNVSFESKKMRGDVLVIDGGLIKPPGNMKINLDIGLPQEIAYACLSETMILAFEGRFENYTLGRGLDIDKVKEITSLGVKHGFSLSEFKSFGKTVTKSDIKRIRENAKN